MKRGMLWLVTLVVLLGGSWSFAAEAQMVTGKVDAVTLYRGQALVTRVVPVDAPAGLVELVVTDLPMALVPESLFAEGVAGVEVRSVRYRSRAVSEEPREAIRKLDAEIEKLDEQIARVQRMQQLIAKRETYLDKLEQFVAPTATVEMSKGVLDAAQVEKLSTWAFDVRQKNVDESLKLANEGRDLEKQLSLLKRSRAQLTAGSTKTIREAVLFLEKRLPGQVNVKLSYLVGGAGWSPAYNFRAGADQRVVAIEYNAIIRQMSGEDWNDASVVLSTATPALSSMGPGLAPFRVALGQRTGGAQTDSSVVSQYKSSQMRLNVAREQQQRAQEFTANRELNWKMNVAGNEAQILELQADVDALRVLRTEVAADLQGPSISYALPARASIASRADQQMVRIANLRLDATFYHVATPVLTGYVYREAELKNTAETALLAGPVSVYLDGRFMGRAEIPTVATGQTFVIGFGADPQLKAAREIADKTERVQGGNRELSFRYRLVLENYKNAPVKVRVFDRIPVADRDADVRVTLGEMKDKISTDELYLRVDRPKGILRWEVDVPPGAAGARARIVEYDYKLAFDRNFSLQMPGGTRERELQKEFEDLQMRRMMH